MSNDDATALIVALVQTDPAVRAATDQLNAAVRAALDRLSSGPDAEESALLNQAADLLYERDDPRATPWPPAGELGHIRSRLRGLTDADPDGRL